MPVAVMTTVPGNVWKILAQQGERVTQGDVLFVLELMKTEIPHPAPVSGTVSAVHLAEGDVVDAEVIAMEIAE